MHNNINKAIPINTNIKYREADLIKFNWAGMTYWAKGNQWVSTATELLSLYSSVYTEGTLQYHSYMQVVFLLYYIIFFIIFINTIYYICLKLF